MRLTTLPLALLSTSLLACVAPVGDDDTTPTPKGDCDLDKAKAVEKDITIRDASDFDDADLPSGCWDLKGTLRIESTKITSLEKLGKLAAVTNLEISNTKLAKLDFAEPLTVYERLSIEDNDLLTTIDDLYIDQDRAITIAIEGNGGLTSLGTLSTLTHVEHKKDSLGNISIPAELVIRDNAKLAAIGFKELAEVQGRFEISGNAALVKLDGLTDLTTVGGEFRISGNAALTTIELGNLENLKRFEIADNAKLTAIGGMRVREIGGDVTIDNNAALANLGMFTLSLKNLSGTLTVSNNPQLTDLGAVSHMTAILGSVVVTNNAKLAYCKALEIDHCVNSGVVSIVGNLPPPSTTCDCWCD